MLPTLARRVGDHLPSKTVPVKRSLPSNAGHFSKGIFVNTITLVRSYIWLITSNNLYGHIAMKFAAISDVVVEIGHCITCVKSSPARKGGEIRVDGLFRESLTIDYSDSDTFSGTARLDHYYFSGVKGSPRGEPDFWISTTQQLVMSRIHKQRPFSVRITQWQLSAVAIVVTFIAVPGCRSSQLLVTNISPTRSAISTIGDSEPVNLVSHQVAAGSEREKHDDLSPSIPPPNVLTMPLSSASLTDLEIQATTSNPMLRRLEQETFAAQARVEFADKLPDPMIAANFFGHPIETAAGSQRSNLTVSQALPWLARLDAQQQQACLEALAKQQESVAARLKVVADVRAMWFRLYVIEKQIETTKANQELLKSLIEVANARVATGKAAAGDVLIGTLEYSKLEEQLVTFRQQRESTVTELNRLAGRDAAIPISGPTSIRVALPESTHEILRQLAWQHQPEIAGAQIKSQAARWGIEVATLQRRPNFSVNASFFSMDNNRPASSFVRVGEDAYSFGGSVSIPLWRRDYDAMENEAKWKHAAAHSSLDEVRQKYDAILRDLWEQAKSAAETANLYKDTILPTAQDTLESDQKSYSNGDVEFDRVVRDFRNLLALELGYHNAVGRLATTLARIEQATGFAAAPQPQSDLLPANPLRDRTE